MAKFDITIRVEIGEPLMFDNALKIIEKSIQDKTKEKIVTMIEYVEENQK